jgi:hypothetical protein
LIAFLNIKAKRSKRMYIHIHNRCGCGVLPIPVGTCTRGDHSQHPSQSVLRMSQDQHL